ncbi:uncharacterized protein LOC101862720 isoform X3 [Aplysia californica]|uniref:Uncharacterized protein LOC101862720 isoform X3 n=2 Tax=Aplysia californica TaxID=6500 RepID=A0ABM1VRH8_APLCA|nr:uncharacterized protein LOC101862720 isoform X3 [Aplysia californica]
MLTSSVFHCPWLEIMPRPALLFSSSVSNRKMDPSKDAEAEVFIRTEFNLQMARHRTVTIHQADCGMDILIGNLKSDLSNLFGEPKNQVWTHRNRVLENEKTFRQYNFDYHHDDRRPLKVHVRSVKHFE